MSNELTGQKATPVAGVLGTKLGMTQVWDENGKLVPVTVVQTGANVVTQVRSVETDGYDACAACAALSWMILPIQGGTASSPYQIMLFHDGRYIGTATSEAYGFHPTVQRTDAGQIQVTWHWPREGESNAGASGTTTATFTWNDATGQVDMAGDVPPV
jgi:hypothetical protein